MTANKLLELNICRGVTLRDVLRLAGNEGMFPSTYDDQNFDAVAQVIIDAVVSDYTGSETGSASRRFGNIEYPPHYTHPGIEIYQSIDIGTCEDVPTLSGDTASRPNSRVQACPACGSTGFAPSARLIGRCQFCDGTVGAAAGQKRIKPSGSA